MKSQATTSSHRFLDESGDTTFFGKGYRDIVGQQGVSLTFGIGMLKVKATLDSMRRKVVELQAQVEQDDYLNVIPSIQRKISRGGFFFHATDDPPEVREIMYKFIRTVDCSFEMVVARKIQDIFARKHHGKESEFYADILSHLLKNKLRAGTKLILNIAHRKNSTSNRNLEEALTKVHSRAKKRYDRSELTTQVVFNIQNQRTEPLLNIADYFCWSVQRIFEKGETRYYDYIRNQISVVIDLYDQSGYAGSQNYYRRNNPLTSANKISPPSP